MSSSCTELAKAKLKYQSDFVQCADLNLDPNQWEKFGSLIDAACRMGSPDSASKNPLIDSNVIKSQCRTDSTKSIDDPTRNDPAMFDFLKKNDSYITFGAGSPMTITWTSDITNSYAFSTNLEASKRRDKGATVGLTMANGPVSLETAFDASTGSGFTLAIGKSQESSHQFSRTVSVTLDDEDAGT